MVEQDLDAGIGGEPMLRSVDGIELEMHDGGATQVEICLTSHLTHHCNFTVTSL